MQLDFLQEDIVATPKESKKTVTCKVKQRASLSPDLFGEIPFIAMPEKHSKNTPEKNIAEIPKKADGAFKTISEAAALLGVPQHVLRFWESRFSQIKPLKMSGGRRYYRSEDIDILSKIHNLLYKQGYTIKGAKKAFGIKENKSTEIKNLPADVSTLTLTNKQKKQVSAIRQELINLREFLRPYLTEKTASY